MSQGEDLVVHPPGAGPTAEERAGLPALAESTARFRL